MQYFGVEPQLLEYSFLLQQSCQHEIGVAGRIDHFDLEPVGSHQRPRCDQAESRHRPGAQDLTTVEARVEALARLRLGGADHGTITAVILGLTGIESTARLISFFLRTFRSA